jgi:hypothetical protein
MKTNKQTKQTKQTKINAAHQFVSLLKYEGFEMKTESFLNYMKTNDLLGDDLYQNILIFLTVLDLSFEFENGVSPFENFLVIRKLAMYHMIKENYLSSLNI